MRGEIELKKKCKYAGDIWKELLEHSDWSVESIIEFLNSIEDADVVEVKHGEWIDKNAWHVECSACGHIHAHIGEAKNYCPNCGAKMDGGKTE